MQKWKEYVVRTMSLGIYTYALIPSIVLQAAQPPQTSDPIQPADVFAHVQLLKNEIEFIRLEMGRPKNSDVQIVVRNVSPREVYFQAVTLFRKTNRLRFEHTREQALEPDMPTGEILPANVFSVVDAGLDNVYQIKETLAIPETPDAPVPDTTKTPTDVFLAIVNTNRQINLLLNQQFNAKEVYQGTTLALAYASRLLSCFPGVVRIPEAPPFERNKEPYEVYQRLIQCLEHVQKITKSSGLRMLELDLSRFNAQNVALSDLYDLTSLLVSELAYLHTKVHGAKPINNVYDPGRKFPSHVYQRLGILEAQLIDLRHRVDQNPNWLHKGNINNE